MIAAAAAAVFQIFQTKQKIINLVLGSMNLIANSEVSDDDLLLNL
jgi:hypothetical protein